MKHVNWVEVDATDGASADDDLRVVIDWLHLDGSFVPARLSGDNYAALVANAYDVADMARFDASELMDAAKRDLRRLECGRAGDIRRVRTFVSVAMHNMQRNMARLMRMHAALALECDARARERWGDDMPLRSALPVDSDAAECLRELNAWDAQRLAS